MPSKKFDSKRGIMTSRWAPQSEETLPPASAIQKTEDRMMGLKLASPIDEMSSPVSAPVVQDTKSGIVSSKWASLPGNTMLLMSTSVSQKTNGGIMSSRWASKLDGTIPTSKNIANKTNIESPPILLNELDLGLLKFEDAGCAEETRIPLSIVKTQPDPKICEIIHPEDCRSGIPSTDATSPLPALSSRSFTLLHPTPVSTVKNMVKDDKAQSPTSPVRPVRPAELGTDPKMLTSDANLTPQDGFKKPAQLASSWEEFTSRNAVNGRIHPFLASNYGRPTANVKSTTPQEILKSPEVDITTLAMPQNIATNKGRKRWPVPLPKPESIREQPTLLPHPLIEEPVYQAEADFFMNKRISSAPVSVSGRSALHQAVSDDGIGAFDRVLDGPIVPPNEKYQEQIDSRNYLAPEVRVEQGLNGLVPALYNFKIEGDPFTFVPTYIKKWAESLPKVEGRVDVECEQFKTGMNPVQNLRIGEPVEHPLCYQDVANSSNTHKQQSQTSEADAKFHQLKKMKRQRHQERRKWVDQFEPAVAPKSPIVLPERNTWACNIVTYIRAAQEKDIPGITAIFNHYVSNSNIPEDQTRVTDHQMNRALVICRANSLPFIVAIKGPKPTNYQFKGEETVLGFGFTEDTVSSIGLRSSGRSRFTAQIEFYVHERHLRKGIGQCILDRLLSLLGPSHKAHGCCDFVCMPGEENVYGERAGTERHFHQIFLHRSFQKKNDPDYLWFSRWLKRFYMFEAGRLISAGRSRAEPYGTKFLDTVIFQFEAAPETRYYSGN